MARFVVTWVQIPHLPPTESTANGEATRLENEGTVTRGGSIPLLSAISKRKAANVRTAYLGIRY